LLYYRVTKYDPAYRNATGAYCREEWTSVADVGRSFGGVVLTPEEFQRVESAYVTAALSFLREAGRSRLTVTGLENQRGCPLAPAEGSKLSEPQLEEVIRRVLREEFWCRLESEDCFLHFGWDYYMYVGVPSPCKQSQQLALRLGLFAEESNQPWE
jgi:hypothetical protein